MIKLQIEDATLQTLDKALLPHVQWKSMRVCDLEGVDTEILNKYLFKMSKPVIKSLIKNKRATPSELTDEQWLEFVQMSANESSELLSSVQMPYSAIRFILDNNFTRRHYGSAIVTTQDAVPVVEALQLMDVYDLNKVLATNSNPGIKHFLFTEEGLEIIKKRNDVIRGLRYLTTAEFQKLGRDFKNRIINPRMLDRAGACDAGKNYCREVLRDLNRTTITWDEAINEIRTNPVLRKRNQLMFYMDWIYDRSQYLSEVEA